MILPLNLAILGLSVLGAFALGMDYGGKRIQVKWDEQKALASLQHIRELEQSQANQQRLQANVNQITEKYHVETNRLNLLAADLRDQLRTRPARPTQSSALPNTASPEPAAEGCTGAQLYRPDAEFLVREAARADQLRESVRECREAYQLFSKPTNQ
jgi:hypothetical protein